MGWFGGKSNDTIYAERIYAAFVDDELGDITPDRLRLPKATYPRFFEKALFYREAMSLCALVEIADKDPKLLPVLREYEKLLETKRVGRNVHVSRKEYIDTAVEDLSAMLANPINWTHHWLMEFRSEPDDETGVVLYADHCLRQYHAFKGGIDNTRPK